MQQQQSWEAARASRIGGTDIAAILGIETFGKGPFEVWARLTGRDDGRKRESSLLSWGQRLERPVLEEYTNLTGRPLDLDPADSLYPAVVAGRSTVERSRDTSGGYRTTLLDAEMPYLAGTSDALALEYRPHEEERLEGVSGSGIVDAKTAMMRRNLWLDPAAPVPEYEYLQVQTYCMLAGTDWCGLAVFVGTDKPLIVRDFPANPDLHAVIRDAVRGFWESHVVPDIPPEAPMTGKRAKTLWLQDNGDTVKLGAEFLEMERERKQLAEDQKALKARIDEIDDAVRAAIGEAAVAEVECPEGTRLRYTYKTSERRGYTVEPTVTRTLRRSFKES